MHAACAIRAAVAQQERFGTWAARAGHPWQLCTTCKLPYTGALKLAALLFENDASDLPEHSTNDYTTHGRASAHGKRQTVPNDSE